MMGRYGPDHLGTAMIIVSLILTLVFNLVGFAAGTIITYIILIFILYRMLSRNIAARRRENDKFLSIWSPIKARMRRRLAALKNIRTHKYFNCPACKNTLRVPRGRGKIQITCPKCGERFIKKS